MSGANCHARVSVVARGIPDNQDAPKERSVEGVLAVLRHERKACVLRYLNVVESALPGRRVVRGGGVCLVQCSFSLTQTRKSTARETESDDPIHKANGMPSWALRKRADASR